MLYLNITGRVVIIMGLFLTLSLFTGRRKIAELPLFDFLTIITVANVVGADIADPKVPQPPTAAAVTLILLLHYVYTYLIIRNRRIGKLLTFEPVVVIENGQLVKGNLKKLRYSIDNVLTMLREQNVFDISEVEFAIIESTGNLSVLKKSQNQPVTPMDIKINTEYRGLSIPLIVEGELYEDNLRKLGLDEDWMMNQLKSKDIKKIQEVFFASINTQGNLYVSKGLPKLKTSLRLRH